MTLYTQADSNVRKTWILIGVFLVLVICLGWVLSYVFSASWILPLAVIFSISWSFVSYWKSDSIILSLSHAHPIKREDNLQLYRIVENLAITAGLPMPKLYVINDESPNAFATGRDPQHSVVCVTQGLLNVLEKSELEGVIAHEMSHIGNRDILLSSVVVVLVGIVALLSRFFIRGSFFGGRSRNNDRGGLGLIVIIIGIVMSLLAPLAAMLLQLSISRKREFLADASGALLTRYPDGLARALAKISQDPHPLKTASNATRSLFISDPFRKKNEKWFTRLWMTHPPVEERIKNLQEMSI